MRCGTIPDLSRARIMVTEAGWAEIAELLSSAYLQVVPNRGSENETS
jgi:hypothetical protein